MRKTEFVSSLKREMQQQDVEEYLVAYRSGHEKHPVLILPNNNLLVYTLTPCFKAVYPFLCSFSEPIDRPRTIHQYRITKFSLYTAMILEYTANDIIVILKKLMKNLKFPKTLQKMIRDYMSMAGRVRMRLKQDFYELITDDEIGFLLGEQLIQKIGQIQVKNVGTAQFDFVIDKDEQNSDIEQQQQNVQITKMNRYKIKGNYFKTTQKLITHNIPLIQQYDFQNDKQAYKIPIEMVNGISMRYYQERAIKHVIINNKARSGLVILPCGAGKSLVAILLIQRIKVNTIIICESEISVEQWKEQLKKWTTIPEDRIVRLTGKHKDKFDRHNPGVVFITTYSMVGRKQQKNSMIIQTQKVKWGLCIADEVHKLPAQTFQTVLKDYLFNIKIGLTATPYRQDNKINDLYYMIGPKLYEQNWYNLVEEGYLAKAYCIEIRCKMTSIFQNQYNLLNKPELLHTGNPTKFRVLQYLIKVHESRGDKILVFCDRPKIIQYYAKILNYAVVHGQIANEQRYKIFNLFKRGKQLNVIFVSRVGDTSIDLPCANVGIQLGMHYKSRRQQVQRMGRIMRAKDNPYNDYNAFFYTLVSLQTKQVSYSNSRQKTIIGQGFQYQIIVQQDLQYNTEPQKHTYIKPLKQLQYITQLLTDHIQGDLVIQKSGEVDIKKKKVTSDVNLLYDEN